MVTEIREQAREALDRDSRLDPVSRVVYGVAVLRSSGQGGKRRYTEAALRDVAGMVGGVRAYADHAEGPRSVRDLLGTYGNGRVEGYGGASVVRADLHYLATAAPVVEAVVEHPAAAGLSVYAAGTVTREPGGVEVVERVDALRSVDLVAEPGSTVSLFESASGRRDPYLAAVEERTPRVDREYLAAFLGAGERV